MKAHVLPADPNGPAQGQAPTDAEPPMRRDRTVAIEGHAFIQNLRRGHCELGADARPGLRTRKAFDELTRHV